MSTFAWVTGLQLYGALTLSPSQYIEANEELGYYVGQLQQLLEIKSTNHSMQSVQSAGKLDACTQSTNCFLSSIIDYLTALVTIAIVGKYLG